MSTRSSIAYAEDFHFFHDLVDDEEGAVYLQLRGSGLDFSASPDSITIRIPPAVWETIRGKAAVSLDFATKTDEEIQALVETHVDERLAEVAAETNERAREWQKIAGSLVYGHADDPREEQVRQGVEHYKAKRAQQQAVIERMALHKAI